MTVIDRYILREWLSVLLLFIGANTGLLLIFALYDNFRDLISSGAAMSDMVLYYGTLMPSYLSVVFPISLLLSLLYVLGRLHRNNEITATRAAGLNIFRTTRVLWFMCICFCCLSLWLNVYVVSWSVERSRVLLESFEFRAESQRGLAADFGLMINVAFDKPQRWAYVVC